MEECPCSYPAVTAEKWISRWNVGSKSWCSRQEHSSRSLLHLSHFYPKVSRRLLCKGARDEHRAWSKPEAQVIFGKVHSNSVPSSHVWALQKQSPGKGTSCLLWALGQVQGSLQKHSQSSPLGFESSPSCRRVWVTSLQKQQSPLLSITLMIHEYTSKSNGYPRFPTRERSWTWLHQGYRSHWSHTDVTIFDWLIFIKTQWESDISQCWTRVLPWSQAGHFMFPLQLFTILLQQRLFFQLPIKNINQ